MGGSSQGATTTSTEPWSGVRPYLTDLYSQASQLGATPTQIAQPTGFAPQEQQAQNMVQNLAGRPVPQGMQQANNQLSHVLQGDHLNRVRPAFNRAQNEIQRTLGGHYLRGANNPFMSGDINPYARGMFDAASRPVIESFNEQALPALTAQFAAGGQLASPQQQAVQVDAASDLQRNLADMSSNIYGNVYESAANRRQAAFENERSRMQGATGLAGQMYGAERGHQMAVMGMAPGLSAAPFQFQANQANMLSGVGQGIRGMEDAQAQAQAAQENANASAMEELLQLQNSLYGSGLNFQTQSTPYYTNPAVSAIGGAGSGALTGAMLGSAIPGLGTGLGAGIGGLTGLLGGFF